MANLENKSGPESMAARIQDIGDRCSVQGNHVLSLDDPDSIWIVRSGSVDVFAVPHDDSGHSLARIHLCRVGQGQLLCGCAGEARELPQLIAVGLPGSEVTKLHRRKISELISTSDRTAGERRADEFAEMLESWVGSMTSGVSRNRVPHDAILLEAGKQQTFAAGATVSSQQNIAWLVAADGEAKFLGRQNVPTELPDRPFPISPFGWIVVDQKTSLTTVPTGSLLHDDRLWSGLQDFHEYLLREITAVAEQEATADFDRLLDKTRAEQRLSQAALTQLAATVRVDSDGFADSGRDPLLAACQLVGQHQGIAIAAPKNYADKKWSDPVEVIARASAVRFRRVALSEGWWTQDNGPLVGFLKEESQPVALLPTSTSSYDIVDPRLASRVPVSASVAKTLGLSAYTFYRSFPPEPLSARDVFRFGLKGTGADWALLCVLGVASGLIGLLIPVATGWIVGNVIPASDQSRLLFVIIALTVAAVVAVLFQFVQGVAMLRIETRMDCAVEAAVWDRLLNIPASFFRRYAAGDLAMRAMGISYIRQALTQSASSSLLTFFASTINFGLLFYYDRQLAMLAVGIFLLVVGATCLAVYFQLPYEREQQRHRGRVWGIVLQLFTGISRLRVAGAEERALAFWARHYSQQTRATIQSQLVSNNLGAFIATLPIVAPLVIFASVSLYPSENLSVAMFMAFYAAFTVIIMSAISMSGTISTILTVVPLFERAKPILRARPEFDLGKRNPGDLTGEIEVSHVSFRYHENGPLILDDVSVHIRPGEYVAFVGPSGAGKSTVLRLLLGFESAEAGSIYYDREDLTSLDQLAVRRQIGVVLQDGKLIPGDIFHNITGSAQLTLEDAWEAARLSGFDEDIKQMPMGMYTFLSDGESTLSGGQRQRLMIARAIVKRPKFLFFDEATSALDNVTQAKVSESLDNLKATRVVIAHRLSTVIHADRICVMNKGQIVQQGSYQELLEQDGLFADLAKRQLL